jgi:hypothetical protein
MSEGGSERETRRKKEDIGKRRTLNHDFDDGCQGFLRRVNKKDARGNEKKGHYHYPPFPTTPAYCRR